MMNVKNPELLNKIGVVLRDLRIKKGMTQADVIDETGIHVGRVETAVGNISVSTVAALAEYYGVKLSDFFKMVEKEK